MALSKIKNNIYSLKKGSKTTRKGPGTIIDGRYYTTYSVVLGTKQDAVKKAEERAKKGYKTVIVYNGKSKVLKDGRSPKKGYKSSYSILS